MAFPQTPLDTRVDLSLAGGWTDVTADVYLRDLIHITRGKADEGTRTDPSKCTLTFNNRSGKYSDLNPRSPLYGQIGRNTRVRVSVPASSTYALLPGLPDETSTITTPDVAALDVLGDIDIRVDLELDNWNTTGGHATELAGKWGATGQQSWRLLVNTSSGGLTFRWSTDGSTNIAYQGTQPLPVPPSGRLAVRATLDVNNGLGGYTVTYYTSDTITGTWVQLDQVVTTAGNTTIFNSTSALQLGNITALSDAVDAFGPARGKLYGFELRSGIGGTVVANPNFTAQTPGATSFTDGAGRAWSMVGSAVITDRDYRFVGEIPAWPPKWDVSGKDVWVPVEAAGPMRRLGQGKKALPSTLTRRIPAYSPLAYWPMEEGSAAVQAYSPIAGVAPLTAAQFTWASADTLAASNPLPVLASSTTVPASMRGSIPAPSGAITGWQVRWIYRLDVGPTTLYTHMRVLSTGTVAEWYVQQRTDLSRIIGKDGDGNVVFSQDIVTGADLYGQWIESRLVVSQSGGNVNWGIVWKNVGGDAGQFTGTFVGTIGRPTGVGGPPNGFASALDGMAIGHISAFGTDSTVAYDGAITAYAGERAGSRLLRLAEETAVPLSVHGVVTDQMQMGPQRPDTLLEVLGQCADADGGILYEDRERLALRYRGRGTLYNQPIALTLDYPTPGHVAPDLAPVPDDQTVRNDVTVTRTNGSSGRVTLDIGPMSTLDPPAGVGVYDDSVTLNVQTDDQTEPIASWLVYLGTWSEARYPTVSVDLAAGPSLIPAARAVDIGDRIQITNPPAWVPPGPIDLIVQGVTETIGAYDWDLVFNCTPAGPWSSIGVTDDPVLGRADTDGSNLAAAATSTATTISVAATLGPAWTTDPTDTPWDIEAGGEVMTVTTVGQVLNANPSFDTNVTGWTAFGGGTLVWAFGASRGSGVARLTTGATSGPGFSATQVTGITPGAQYRAMGWILAGSALPAGVEIAVNWFDSASTYLSTSNNLRVPTVGTYALWDAVFTAPANAARASILLSCGGTPGAGINVFGDDIKLIPVSTYTSSPQTFTVTRSVNGISKAQASGTAVSLATPAYTAL